MNSKEFIEKTMKNELRDFKHYWKQSRKQYKEDFPDNMEEKEWIEQLHIYMKMKHALD